MSWRTVIISTRAKLDLQLNYLVVRGVETKKIFINEISTIIVENTAVALTTALLCELAKRKVKVVFCDEKRNPISEMVPYYGSHDTSDKVRNQISWTKENKNLIWTEIVSEKIRKQRDCLKYLDKSKGVSQLNEYISEIEVGDTTNREGHAAKVYFNSLFGLEFTRTADNAINAALNYGYSILLSTFNREVVANGYITQLGLFHDNTFNQFNLSCDLMEPFRPLIDCCVYKLKPTSLNKDVKLELVNILNGILRIDGQEQYISNAIAIYCKSVFEALNMKDVSLIKFFDNELQIYESIGVF